jgi:hypothetical protein
MVATLLRHYPPGTSKKNQYNIPNQGLHEKHKNIQLISFVPFGNRDLVFDKSIYPWNQLRTRQGTAALEMMTFPIPDTHIVYIPWGPGGENTRSRASKISVYPYGEGSDFIKTGQCFKWYVGKCPYWEILNTVLYVWDHFIYNAM